MAIAFVAPDAVATLEENSVDCSNGSCTPADGSDDVVPPWISEMEFCSCCAAFSSLQGSSLATGSDSWSPLLDSFAFCGSHDWDADCDVVCVVGGGACGTTLANLYKGGSGGKNVKAPATLDLENPDRAQRQNKADIAGGQQQLMIYY